jgi:hypothetical protein
MPAFLAPLIGTAARVAGPTIARTVGPAALRTGAAAFTRSRVVSAAQFGARMGKMMDSSGPEASNQTVQRTPGPVQIG